jgi:hypothetical protein
MISGSLELIAKGVEHLRGNTLAVREDGIVKLGRAIGVY